MVEPINTSHPAPQLPVSLAGAAALPAPARICGKMEPGTLTILHGGLSLGKSVLACGQAAEFTRGFPLANGGRSKPASVAIAETWDAYDDTVGPRVHAAGADLDRVAFVPKGVSDAITIERLDVFEGIYRETAELRLLVLDTLNLNAAAELRPATLRDQLASLLRWSKDRRVAILGILPVGGGAATTRAIHNAATSVYSFRKTPKDRKVVAMTPTKGPIRKAFRYRIVSGPAPTIEWLD